MTKPTLPHLPKKPKHHAMQQELIVMGFKPSLLAKIGGACAEFSKWQSLTGGVVDIELRKFAKEADKIVKGEGI